MTPIMWGRRIGLRHSRRQNVLYSVGDIAPRRPLKRRYGSTRKGAATRGGAREPFGVFRRGRLYLLSFLQDTSTIGGRVFLVESSGLSQVLRQDSLSWSRPRSLLLNLLPRRPLPAQYHLIRCSLHRSAVFSPRITVPTA